MAARSPACFGNWVVANGPASGQMLLNQVERWLNWTGMKAKVPKCCSLALQSSTAKMFDPALSLQGQQIPYSKNQPVIFLERWLNWTGMKAKVPKCCSLALQSSTAKMFDPALSLQGQQIPYSKNQPVIFLGGNISIPADVHRQKRNLSERLETLLERVDGTLVTGLQKLLYKAGICPRMMWGLAMANLPVSWILTVLEGLATRYLKRWSGLACSADIACLYLPKQDGGLGLPSVSLLYKKMKLTEAATLLALRDSLSRQVTNDDAAKRREHTVSLPSQGELMRAATFAPDIWANAVCRLGSEGLKFILNAATDSLPHNCNLVRWRGCAVSEACRLCGKKQTLLHVLNGCEKALQLRRYNQRHDRVLTVIKQLVLEYIPETNQLTADMDNSYQFPTEIAATSLRPDIVVWSQGRRELYLVELTICYETGFAEPAKRKQSKYLELMDEVTSGGFKPEAI